MTVEVEQLPVSLRCDCVHELKIFELFFSLLNKKMKKLKTEKLFVRADRADDKWCGFFTP